MFNQIFVIFKTLNSSHVLFIGLREKQGTIIPVGMFFGTYIRKKTTSNCNGYNLCMTNEFAI